MSKYSENIPPSIVGAIGWFLDDIKEGSSLLDFGCSTGYYGSYIREHKKSKVYGVEISDDIKLAAKVLDGVYSFDLDGDWPDEIYERTYDAIFFGDVIEHLKDPQTTLAKCQKLLNKNGKIYVSTPNVAHLSVRLELLGGNFEYESMGILDNTHLKYFTLKTLKEISAGAGYDIDRIDSSLSDYPREVTTAILKKYGLTPNETFWKMTVSPEARTFQYKLKLSLAKNTPKISKTNPVVKPEQFKKDFIVSMEKGIQEANVKLRDAGVLIMSKEVQNQELQKSLAEIRDSKTFKLASKIAGIKRRVVGR